MQKNFFKITGLLICLFSFSGCALFLLGAGGVGGYAISQDTMEGHFDKSYDSVWTLARSVMTEEGFIRLEDKSHGTIEGEVDKSQVDIEVLQLTAKTVRLRVKARKGYKLLPNADLANELYNNIAGRIK